MKAVHAAILVACALGAGLARAGTVTVTAADVFDLDDYERVIREATNNGTEPGTVVFDGSKGAFTCDFGVEPDDTINIRVSHLRLVGINGADTGGPGDGLCSLFLDDVPLEGLLVQGLLFRDYGGNAILSGGESPRRDVTIRHNVIHGGINGITVHNAIDWTISDNRIDARTGAGIALYGSRSARIVGNTLSGERGIALGSGPSGNSRGALVLVNRIDTTGAGLTLAGPAEKDAVLFNTVKASADAAVVLEVPSTHNRVQWNRLQSAIGDGNAAVQDLGTHNRVSGNRP